jgi:hypothetical protein
MYFDTIRIFKKTRRVPSIGLGAKPDILFFRNTLKAKLDIYILVVHRGNGGEYGYKQERSGIMAFVLDRPFLHLPRQHVSGGFWLRCAMMVAEQKGVPYDDVLKQWKMRVDAQEPEEPSQKAYDVVSILSDSTDVYVTLRTHAEKLRGVPLCVPNWNVAAMGQSEMYHYGKGGTDFMAMVLGFLDKYNRNNEAMRSMMEKIIRAERVMHDEWFVFYHAEHYASTFMSNVLRSLRDITDLKPQHPDTTFYRGRHAEREAYQNVKGFFASMPDILDMPGDMQHGFPVFSDSQEKPRRALVAMNMTLFLSSRRDEETLNFFFESSRGWMSLLKEEFRASLTELGVAPDTFDSLFTDRTPTLKQVFIRKKSVSRVAYLSRDYGYPIRIRRTDSGAPLSLFQTLRMYRDNPKRLNDYIRVANHHYVRNTNHLQCRLVLVPSLIEDTDIVRVFEYSEDASPYPSFASVKI